VYRMVALPCLLAAGIFGVWLVARMRSIGIGRLARATALGLCVVSPVMMRALELGHPEEILGAVLCVSALLAARSGHAAWAGLLLGLALATKAWALLAVPPVVFALPAHRWRLVTVAGAVAGAILAPLALAHSSHYLSSSGVAAQTGAIFQPWQAWWWLGSHGTVVHGTFGDVKVGYRAAPSWISGVSHPLIILLAVPLTALWLARRSDRPWEPLALLTLLFLLRCVLDPWNNVYYSLPFLFALLVWETLGRREAPLLSLAATVMVWVSFQELPGRVGPDAQSALYLAWTVPFAASIALWLYAPASWERLRRRTVSRGNLHPRLLGGSPG
jgi:Glycosyltransferase family 87